MKFHVAWLFFYPDSLFTDQLGGATTERPGLIAVFEVLRPGDILVIWRLDRLGRSLKHLIQMVDQLDKIGVGLRSLQESIDTTTAGGRLIFHVFGALAEFERHLIRERTQAGVNAARARGGKGEGRGCSSRIKRNWRFVFTRRNGTQLRRYVK